MEYVDSWSLVSTVMIGVPFLVIFVVFFVFLRRQSRVNAESLQRQREYVTRSVEHMNRVEEQLERLIAVADGDSETD